MNANSKFHVAIRDHLPYANATSHKCFQSIEMFAACGLFRPVSRFATRYGRTVSMPSPRFSRKRKQNKRLVQFLADIYFRKETDYAGNSRKLRIAGKLSCKSYITLVIVDFWRTNSILLLLTSFLVTDYQIMYSRKRTVTVTSGVGRGGGKGPGCGFKFAGSLPYAFAYIFGSAALKPIRSRL